jgi:hypothetical protein
MDADLDHTASDDSPVVRQPTGSRLEAASGRVRS